LLKNGLLIKLSSSLFTRKNEQTTTLSVRSCSPWCFTMKSAAYLCVAISNKVLVSTQGRSNEQTEK